MSKYQVSLQFVVEASNEVDAIAEFHKLAYEQPLSYHVVNSITDDAGVIENESYGYEFDEPADDDYVITYNGRLRSRYQVSVNWKHFGDYAEWSDLVEAIEAQMNLEQFWPNVWHINDHGNVELVTLRPENEGNENV